MRSIENLPALYKETKKKKNKKKNQVVDCLLEYIVFVSNGGNNDKWILFYFFYVFFSLLYNEFLFILLFFWFEKVQFINIKISNFSEIVFFLFRPKTNCKRKIKESKEKERGLGNVCVFEFINNENVHSRRWCDQILQVKIMFLR